MIKKYNETYKTTYRKFESISDLVNTIQHSCVNPIFENPDEQRSAMGNERFTGTFSYEEAENMLLHGWDYMSKELTRRLNVQNNGMVTKQKNVYDVVGYQTSVPRYLQGIPTNMIRQKQVKIKNKVIVLNKSIGYSCKVKKEQIIEESVKALQLVRSLEAKGYKVELNIVCIIGDDRRVIRYDNSDINGIAIKICLKRASQRLNIKQTAFPLVHPSMLRRIILRLIERSEECNRIQYLSCYGYPVMPEHKIYKELFKGEYLIPAIVSEPTIEDISKYLL